jgi:hypothetical protein
LKKYKNEINGAFSIRMAENADSLAITSGLRFPTFFLIKNIVLSNLSILIKDSFHSQRMSF